MSAGEVSTIPHRAQRGSRRGSTQGSSVAAAADVISGCPLGSGARTCTMEPAEGRSTVRLGEQSLSEVMLSGSEDGELPRTARGSGSTAECPEGQEQPGEPSVSCPLSCSHSLSVQGGSRGLS